MDPNPGPPCFLQDLHVPRGPREAEVGVGVEVEVGTGWPQHRLSLEPPRTEAEPFEEAGGAEEWGASGKARERTKSGDAWGDAKARGISVSAAEGPDFKKEGDGAGL